MDDEPVCCETPMIRHDDYDPYEQAYYYYVCLQCGHCTEEIWTEGEEVRPWHAKAPRPIGRTS